MTDTCSKLKISTMNEELLTVNDVAKIAGVTPAAVRVWANLGRLHTQRTLSGTRLFRRADVTRWLRERERERSVQRAV